LKKNKISKNWINKQRRDIYVRRSKVEGYRSRAVYKLQEIDQKFRIFKNGMSVIDLGAAPGSWSQYVLKNVKNGKIVSIDFKDFEKIGNIHQIKGDFTDDRYKKEIVDYFGVKVDVVLSDLAVNTTGNKNLDSIYTGELCMEAMKFSKEILKSDGKLISKIFMGSTFNEIVSEAKKIFKENKVFKPLASRKDSKESFIICKFLR
jgi:23S rRNA (uridine2552-2'-O)-methyltransferase|tara:strand:+ start:1110 stop:1721 length:612 start_codon:yes stop_codon:yes gene_type:complete